MSMITKEPRRSPLSTPALVTERYRALAIHLGGARERGWQTRVSIRLGISAQKLSNVLNGQRTVGWNQARDGATRVGLDPRFFSDADGLRYLATMGAPVDAESEAIRALTKLDDATRARVLAWARDRWPA